MADYLDFLRLSVSVPMRWMGGGGGRPGSLPAIVALFLHMLAALRYNGEDKVLQADFSLLCS